MVIVLLFLLSFFTTYSMDTLNLEIENTGLLGVSEFISCVEAVIGGNRFWVTNDHNLVFKHYNKERYFVRSIDDPFFLAVIKHTVEMDNNESTFAYFISRYRRVLTFLLPHKPSSPKEKYYLMQWARLESFKKDRQYGANRIEFIRALEERHVEKINEACLKKTWKYYYPLKKVIVMDIFNSIAVRKPFLGKFVSFFDAFNQGTLTIGNSRVTFKHFRKNKQYTIDLDQMWQQLFSINEIARVFPENIIKLLDLLSNPFNNKGFMKLIGEMNSQQRKPLLALWYFFYNFEYTLRALCNDQNAVEYNEAKMITHLKEMSPNQRRKLFGFTAASSTDYSRYVKEIINREQIRRKLHEARSTQSTVRFFGAYMDMLIVRLFQNSFSAYIPFKQYCKNIERKLSKKTK